METLTLCLLLLAAVLVSSVIDQIVPKVSLPLIQIALGLGIALLASTNITIGLDPELFLVLFIAPLLYDEAKNADKAALWIHIKPVLSLAIGLVVATTLIIGFTLNLIIPSIPLFAAFALGAALGPTDAVAVTSLSKEIAIPARQKSVLKGELLLNDASGIVSFQFAIAAGVTGSFSLLNATEVFLLEFFGGLAAGVALGVVGNLIVRKARSIGVENTTFHVLFEVFTPFLVYLISQAIHVSGIIAVVVAGLVNVISPRMMGPSVSRMNIVSSSVWRVLSFALNGIVFVLLGTQLPNAMRRTWDDVSISNGRLIAYVIGLTLLLLAIRFAWVLAMDWMHARRGERRRFTAHDAKMALVTTLCGAKGTITLSIMLTIPMYLSYATVDHPAIRFPQRDLLIFLACGVIVCTLLLATFVVPLLAPKPARKESEQEIHDRDTACYIDILRTVIEELTTRQTPENRGATRAVIRSYNDRIELIKENNDIESESDIELRLQALKWERVRALEIIEEDAVSPMAGFQYLRRLDRTERLLRHSSESTSFQTYVLRLRALLRRGLHALIRELPSIATPTRADELRQLQLACTNYVIALLEITISDSAVPTEDATALLLEYQNARMVLQEQRPTITTAFKVVDRAEDVRRLALCLELEQIQTSYEEGRLSREGAKRMRENVNLMQLDLEDNV